MANVHIHVAEESCSSCDKVTLKVYYGKKCDDINTSVTVFGEYRCLGDFVNKNCKLYKDEACSVNANDGYYKHESTGGACDETTIYKVDSGVVNVTSC